MPKKKHNNIETYIQQALDEDGIKKDITSHTFLIKNPIKKAILTAKESGIFSGEKIINPLINQVDQNVNITLNTADGKKIKKNQTIATLEGPLKSLLKIERTLLNFIQRLSGIATQTQRYIQALNNPKIKILDTRKTTPGLRPLEKDAVVAGGGYNHRYNLSDMILIKENHLSQIQEEQSIEDFKKNLKESKINNPNIKIEIEIESIDQLKTLPLKYVDIIMLDNFETKALDQSITYCRTNFNQAEIEISGNITLKTIKKYSHLDIDRISIGSLTHSVKALDISLLIN